MPRKHRRDPAWFAPPEPVSRPWPSSPDWAQIPGARVHGVAGDKTYRCPGCQQEIRPRLPHLVVMEEDDVEGRRHWHTPCWQRELRRRGNA